MPTSTIDTSGIDSTKPAEGSATTQSVRDNTSAIKSQIEAAKSDFNGLGTMADQDADSVTISGGSIAGITDLAVADGGTGASTESGARTNLDLFSRTELTKAIGNITHPLTDLDLQSAAGVRASKFAGDFQFLRESSATYVDRYGVLHKTSYYSGTPTSTGSNSITDTGLSLTRGDLVDYIVYLTDGSAEAYRWVSANGTTQVFWTDPIDFTPTSYKISQPRFEADGMLVEGSSTNLLTYSEDFSQWANQNCTVTTGAVTLAGNISGDKLEATADGVSGRDSATFSVTAGEYHTFSIYAKQGNTDAIAVVFKDLVSTGWQSGSLYFDGTVDGSTGAAWEYLGMDEFSDGSVRFRCRVLADQTVSTAKVQVRLSNNDAAPVAGDYIYVGAAQLEELPFASSYIPTTSAAATRAADVLGIAFTQNMPGADCAFSVIADYDVFGYWVNYARIFDVSGGRRLHASGTDSTSLYGYDGATSVIAGDQDTNTVIRAGYSSDTSNQYIYADGVTQSTASYTAPTESGDLYIGCASTGERQLYGHIPKFRIYDSALTDSEMRVA